MKKLLLPIIGLFLLSGCDDAPDNYIEQEPTPIVEVVEVVDFDEPEYTENDVFSFYTSCLLIEGIQEDDYCEEVCADEFDYDSCDFAEDTISDLLSVGKDLEKEKAKRYSHKVVKSESKWFKKGSPKCSNNKCTQTYYKTIYYKDGSSSKSYKTETYTQKNTNSATKTTTGSTSVTASKYSSNLTSTKPKEDTSKTKSATNNTTTTTSTTASKYSSNLTATKPKEEPKEEVVEESSIGVGEVAVGAAAVGTAAALTTNTKPKSKTVKKDTGWKKSGSPYSCGSYSPSASSKPKGKKFTQKRSCKQKEVRTITYSDGSVDNSSRVTSVSQSKDAVGTKAKPKAKKKKNKKKK
jgi:hypothetical protein